MQNDGSESAVFQQLFQKWTVPNQTSGLGKTYTVGSVGEGRAKQGGRGDRSGAKRAPDLPSLFRGHNFGPCSPGGVRT